MANVLVLGATGDVGRGIAAAQLQRGHRVLAVARHSERLQALTQELGSPPGLHTLTGTIADDSHASQVLSAVRAIATQIDVVVVSVNGARQLAPLLSNDSAEFAARIALDLVTHFTAARAFLPALAPNGVYLGIGGGSADFMLENGAYMSIAQAGLRMLYRGLAHEQRERNIHVRELIIASVVNGASTRVHADPLWVTDQEIGEHVANILASPANFAGPILRMASRDATGRPVLTTEPATRVQGLRS